MLQAGFSGRGAQWNKRHKEALVKKKTVIIGSAIAAVVVLGGTGAAVAASGAMENDAQLTGTTLEKASKAALAETGEGRVTDSESDDGGYEIEVTLDNGSAVDLWLNESYEVVRVGSDDDSDDNGDDNGAGDTALTEAERADAEKAALAEVPGTVTEVERSDDGNQAFEVEVTREDGTTVDVELDESFAVVTVDEDGTDDDDNGTSSDDSK
jgi:uncharacterized membrane protein YkoI